MENNIILYTLNCAKCKILEFKLKQKNIEFAIVDDDEAVIEFGKAHKIFSAPILKVNEDVMDFTKAIQWINSKGE